MSFGQLSNNVSGQGRCGLIGVNLTCNKARYVSALVLKHFCGFPFYEIDVCFHFSLF